MTFEVRLIVVALSAFAGTSLLASALVPTVARRASQVPVPNRPDALFWARALPTAAGLAAATLALLAYLAFERRGNEPVGLLIPMLSALAVAGLGVGALRLVRTLLTTRAAVTRWMATAVPIARPGLRLPLFAVESAFPIVAVVGVLRPRIIIARSVLAACPDDELRAILMHERHHVERRDNLKRALLVMLPDPLTLLPASSRLLAAWRDAGEDAADECADRLGEGGRPALAQALLRVARLASSTGAPALIPASALYSGGNLERRVRRLLAPSTSQPRRAGTWVTPLLLGVSVAALAALGAVHHVIEYAVTHLP